MVKRLFSRYFELIFWITALSALALTDPTGSAHFSLCPLKAIGFAWCPGCGLGHSISWLFHGNIGNSWHAHWLGIPALCIIFYRIVILFNQRIIHYKSIPVYR